MEKKVGALLVLAVMGIFPLLFWANGYHEAKVVALVDRETIPVIDGLNSMLQRYRDAIRTVESLRIVQDVADARQIRPETLASMDTLRTYLEVESLFVMDNRGTQLAGSGAVSVGRNYGFRPYFQQAIAGKNYIYPGIGANLRTPRMFFSAPHYSEKSKSPSGVVGLSVGMEKLTALLNPGKTGAIMGLITEDGVVFASSHQELLYRTVLPITQSRLKAIRDSRQFGDKPVDPSGISLEKTQVVLGNTSYFVNRDKLQATNIEFFSLHPVDRGEYLGFMGSVGFVYLLVVFLGFRLFQSDQRRRAAEKITQERKRELDRDIELARRVQWELLPALPESPFIIVQRLYYPSNFVSGDSYHLEWLNDGMLLRGFLIDVSGHGLATAIQTSSINVLLREEAMANLPLQGQLQWINARAAKYFIEGAYAAILGFELDLPARELRYAGAGITQFYVNGRKIKAPGMFVGMWQDAEFDIGALTLAAGDSIHFLTDGFTDALSRPENADFFSSGGKDFDTDVASLDRLAKDGTLRDDATGVCIHVRSLPDAG